MINRVKDIDKSIEDLTIEIEYMQDLIQEKEQEKQDLNNSREQLLMNSRPLTFDEENYILEYQMELERERKEIEING